MYFTTRDPKATYGTLGKGWVAGACDVNRGLHAMIMEYQYDDITFARVSISTYEKVYHITIKN
jgi:hypothetical protein